LTPPSSRTEMTGRLQVLGFEGRAEEEKGIEEEK